MYMRGSQWKHQRGISLQAPVRRAHPASGATWNVQVVKGKMSTQCLWHACRALIVGILLMIIGASMATIGYYSNDFVLGENRNGSNNTPPVRKTDQRGLHLNNLSYMGPIVMGVGGFIVVASCVMTFEARDSAAKVVPARFKVSGSGGGRSGRSSGSRRTTSVRSSDSRNTSVIAAQNARWEQQNGIYRNSSPANESLTDRHALTAALIHFSRNLGSPKCVPQRRVSKCGSVPNLHETVESPLLKKSPRRIPRHHKHAMNNVSRRGTGILQQSGAMKLQRFALSVDETHPLQQDSAHGSQCSVTFDPTPEIIDIVPVHKKRERTKRSDTARKHVLSRQKPIEKEENHHQSPKIDVECRPSSAMSESSFRERRRTGSVDSRSPDRCNIRQSPRKTASILSTPSFDRDFRSQLSICSEPTVALNQQLSCQSSIEPCVPEEDAIESSSSEMNNQQVKQQRPDSLILNLNNVQQCFSTNESKKYLQRSQSTKVYNKKSSRPKSSRVMSNDLDQIYVISSNTCMQSDLEDYYDSIDVIHERRSKNFSKFNDLESDKESETMMKTQNENIVETIVDIEPHRCDENDTA